MAIELNGRTKLTADVEKRLVELGGADPDRTLTRDELAGALVAAVDALAEQGRIHLLEKLYLAGRQSRPEWPTLEALRDEAS